MRDTTPPARASREFEDVFVFAVAGETYGLENGRCMLFAAQVTVLFFVGVVLVSVPASEAAIAVRLRRIGRNGVFTPDAESALWPL